jgi:hypothetical protein
MKSRYLLIILLIYFTITGIILTLNRNVNSSNFLKNNKIKIATCPTCNEIAKKLDPKRYQIITTISTAQSIELIKNKQADLMLAGRTLKPNEPQMDKVIIKEGYSFIGDKEISIYIDELKNYIIYTDLDIESIKKEFKIEKIEKVVNVYDYLNQGIIITSWENTDYYRAQIVHILEKNGDRLKISRQPTFFCPENCSQEIKEMALLLK